VVFFCKMDKIKRGRYHLDIVEVTTTATSDPPHHITDTYFKLLESSIQERPELWLWSHKRWKFDSSALPDRKVSVSQQISKK
jgi:Kdo2-lipid IVA lauroyltransferase/acyltransferase